jgi:hypothetical protein
MTHSLTLGTNVGIGLSTRLEMKAKSELDNARVKSAGDIAEA